VWVFQAAHIGPSGRKSFVLGEESESVFGEIRRIMKGERILSYNCDYQSRVYEWVRRCVYEMIKYIIISYISV
jgi:hypothetical protein